MSVNIVSDDKGGTPKGGCVMHLKDIVIKCAVIVAIGAVVWLGLGMFNDTADDNASTAMNERTSQHQRVENL